MPRRPTKLISPQRRALLAAAVGAGCWPAARGQVAGNKVPQVLQSVLPAGARFELPFEVRAEGDKRQENRVVFGTLRSTAPIAAITLLDPARRRIWRRTPAELGLTPRDQTSRPDLGETIVLPEIRNAVDGHWTLLLERAAPHVAPGRLLLAWRVLPRYELLLATDTPSVAAGQPLLVTLRAMDYGAPITGLRQIELTLLDVGGQPLSRVPALERARSREGILLSDEPGIYIASLTLPHPGAYRLRASHGLGSAPHAVTVDAEIAVNAGAPGGALRLTSVRPESTPAGCVGNLVFRFQAEVAEPGTYVCNLLLRAGDPAAPRASGSATLAAGRASIDVIVSAAKWRAAANPSTLARVTLLRIDSAGLKLLVDLHDLSLAEHTIDTAALCK